MTWTATITSKHQLTIPAEAFRKLNLRTGQKLSIHMSDQSLHITPMEKLIDDLAGSVKLPKKFKNKDTDEIIALSKKEYFDHKWQ